MCDNLNTHMSEGVVRLVARQCGIDAAALGRKGRHGVLATRASRQAFPRDRSHRIMTNASKLPPGVLAGDRLPDYRHLARR